MYGHFNLFVTNQSTKSKNRNVPANFHDVIIGLGYDFKQCTWQRSSLRHYATSRKVADSIPDEVIGFFN
jgi:hypothetical protein